MDYKEIKILLNKYLEGNSSLEEEKLLRKFFEDNQEMPKDLVYARHLFNYFGLESMERSDYPDKNHSGYLSKKRYISVISGIAAGILIIIGIFLFTDNQKNQKIYAYHDGKPISDKQYAINETKRALLLISSNLNQGTRDLNYLTKMNEVEQLIIKTK